MATLTNRGGEFWEREKDAIIALCERTGRRAQFSDHGAEVLSVQIFGRDGELLQDVIVRDQESVVVD